MKLAIYADESGTHDPTGEKKGSREGILAGIVAPVGEWANLTEQWKRVLNRYGANYFHFSEWSAASSVVRGKREPSSKFKNNPYRNWSNETLNKFLIELATLVGSGNKLFVAGSVYTKIFHEEKTAKRLPDKANPYEHCTNKFFEQVASSISSRKKPWKRMPLSFLFDQTDDVKWQCTILNAHKAHKEKHPTFKDIAFTDKKLMPHLPLQAADMFAYRARQMTENWVDNDFRVWSELDQALFKNDFDYLDVINKQSGVLTKAFMRGGLDYDGKGLNV